MLNTILAWLAVVVWSTAYGWFFAADLRRWWLRRHWRRAQAATDRAHARRAYAAWVRNIPPPRSRMFVMPKPATPPVPTGPQGVVIPFPRGVAPRR